MRKRRSKKARTVKDPQAGSSYGLDCPFLVTREDDEWLVYRAVFKDGRRQGGHIVGVYPIERHGEDLARIYAHRMAIKLNGLDEHPSPEVHQKIDATP